MLNASLHRRAAACGAPSRPTWQLQPQQPCFVRRAVRPVRFKDDKSEDAQTTDTTSLAAKKAATKIAVFSSGERGAVAASYRRCMLMFCVLHTNSFVPYLLMA